MSARSDLATGSTPDVADWESTYREHAPRLMRMAAVLVGPADAGDLVADAVLRAVRSRRWAELESRGAFLTTVLVNEARRRGRSDRRRIAREQRITPRLEYSDRDPWIELVPIVASLSMRQRGVVYFAYWEDLSIPQIAIVMGISEGTVRRHLDRAKRQLRERIPDADV
jgi:RNA polymerase sigma-70 factor (ECF subfamily)